MFKEKIRDSKFELKDKVYYLKDNKVVVSEVREISLSAKSGFLGKREDFICSFMYYLTDGNYKNESNIFASKEELLASL